MPDKFTVEILADGSLKLGCGKISQAQHINAENFLREVQRLAGGPVRVSHTHGTQGQHTHEGESAHQH